MNSTEWDKRYRLAAAAGDGRLWSSLPHRSVQEIVDGLALGSALDVATGDGRNAVFLAGRGWSVTAVDFSAEGIRIARDRAGDARGVAWVVADAREYEPHRSFELVVMTYLHLNRAENEAMVARSASWVEPGGHLLVLGHDEANLLSGAPGPQDADVLYTTELLERGCAGLRIIRSEKVLRDTTLDPESSGEDAKTAVDTLLFAQRPGS